VAFVERLADNHMLSFLIRGTRRDVLLRAVILIAAIALVDQRIQAEIPLGFLYLFPMLLVGSVLNRWQIAATAGVCTFLTEQFDSFVWSPSIGIPRDILLYAAFIGMGLLICEVVRNRQVVVQHLEQIEIESQARRATEEQLEILIKSSPAAVFTADSEGHVLIANDAAHQLLGTAPGALSGRSIFEYLPSLANVPAPHRKVRSFRTVMEARGRRQNGDVFFADIWFSTYQTSAGSRLAAMVIDTSEEVKNREESSLHQVLTASRVLMSAVSHEIRNISGAIGAVQEQLEHSGSLAQSKDFETLRTLIQALGKITAMNLPETAYHPAAVDVQSLLDELRIIIQQSLGDEGVEVHWDIDPGVPHAWADRHSLLQVFLNLAKNSERAMLNQERRDLTISAKTENQRIAIRFQDTGCGIADPDRLFRPFQKGAQGTGLGLFLSRELMKSFCGDLRYEPAEGGSIFIVELLPASQVM
jgi:two-component system, LuxR family, sensor kinase FixL